jgi:hypothetical protein
MKPASASVGVERAGRVALAQDEAIALRVPWILRIDPQRVEEQRREDVRGGEITARMTEPGGVHHPQARAADVAGAGSQILHEGHTIRSE